MAPVARWLRFVASALGRMRISCSLWIAVVQLAFWHTDPHICLPLLLLWSRAGRLRNAIAKKTNASNLRHSRDPGFGLYSIEFIGRRMMWCGRRVSLFCESKFRNFRLKQMHASHERTRQFMRCDGNYPWFCQNKWNSINWNINNAFQLFRVAFALCFVCLSRVCRSFCFFLHFSLESLAVINAPFMVA